MDLRTFNNRNLTMTRFIRISLVFLLATFAVPSTTESSSVMSAYLYQTDYSTDQSVKVIPLEDNRNKGDSTNLGKSNEINRSTRENQRNTNQEHQIEAKNQRNRRSPIEDYGQNIADDRMLTRGSALAEADSDSELASSVSSTLTNIDQILKTVDISAEKINETIAKNKPTEQIENERDDPHNYYKYSQVNFEDFWVDMSDANVHYLLSKSHRRAATIALSFPLPFYGHDIDNVTIATGGFIYTGQHIHSWLAATQYVAPLMANFDTSNHEDATIKYKDNGTALIVEWDNVYLSTNEIMTENDDQETKDPNDPAPTTTIDPTKTPTTTTQTHQQSQNITELPFTFQAILHKSGDIIFVYKTVPVNVTTIKEEVHPVKVGLSDAYIMDRTIFYVKRKTIFEYHRVGLTKNYVQSGTAIFFEALPTCNRMLSCEKCINLSSDNLECKWCPGLSKCSDGIDRNRQAWLTHSCEANSVNSLNFCTVHRDIPDSEFSSNGSFVRGDDEKIGDGKYEEVSKSPHISPKGETSLQPHHAGGIATLLVSAFILVSLVAWVGYAYFFPHTWSGQLLIKYRPTRWHWLRSEPRYTAASIHM